MLRSINQIHGAKLGAVDGEIGRVKDVYFDDLKWVVRYLVTDTGAWMTGGLVLIAPHAIGAIGELCDEQMLLVNRTRNQIKSCPPADAHKPLSRQYEEEYYRYYGWPVYWQGDGLWGMSDFPILSQRSESVPGERGGRAIMRANDGDAHLRSARVVTGYGIQATDKLVGHLSDFLVDDKTWAIRHLVVDVGSWFARQKVQISTAEIERISWDQSKVFVHLTREEVKGAPAYEVFEPRIFA
ncbi:MAG: hypothetical protein JWM16_5762 [Verrucomicrobiales bacterium]|nr:hypothetical protein [Verrucomicrobiales bacterium]